jgi:putative transposase
MHIVAAIPPKLAVSELVKRLKGASAHYLNYEVRPGRRFTWERGYGALSVGQRQRPIAVRYVERQKEHHGHNTTNIWLERADELDEGPEDMWLPQGEKNANE